MSDREKPGNPARTTQPDDDAQPGDERVVRRGRIKENTDDESKERDERYDAG